MRIVLLALGLLVSAIARAQPAPAPSPFAPNVPGVPNEAMPGKPDMAVPMQIESPGPFSRTSRLNLGLTWFAWSAAAGLGTTALVVGNQAPSDERLQTLALSLPVGTLYAPMILGSLYDGGCGDGTDSGVARWRDAGALGSVVFGLSWVTRALVAGALARSDAVYPAYVGALAGSAIEAIGVALIAAR